MKLHDIHVLMSVVQTGSMGKAAALLNTTQSAISRSIADLEHTVGVRLLDRSPQGVEPTHYGRALLKRSVAVFDELKQSVQDIEFLSDPGKGELCIGSSPAQAEGFIFTVLDRLSRQYPRIIVQVALGGILEPVTNCGNDGLIWGSRACPESCLPRRISIRRCCSTTR